MKYRHVFTALLASVTAAAPMALSSQTEGDASLSLAPNALRLTFLGTGAPRPSTQRYGPSILVEAGQQRILLESSWGGRERIMQAGGFELLTGIDHVLLTHLHFDHTIGLSDLWLTGWLYGRRLPLRVQGPVGTANMVAHLQQAFQWDVDYRVLVGVPVAGSTIEATDVAPGVVYEHDGLKVTAFQVEHMPIDLATRERLDFEGQTFGYRIDYRGHSVAFSGDTRPSESLVAHSRGVDVLVHETQVPSPGATEEAKLANVSLSVHSDPEQVARTFARAKPRLAVYSHIIPPGVEKAELLEASQPYYDGPIEVAHDLMMITIGEQIEVEDRPHFEETAFEASKVLK